MRLRALGRRRHSRGPRVCGGHQEGDGIEDDHGSTVSYHQQGRSQHL